MSLVNTKQKFGSLTKLLHWTLFVLFVIQYFLAYRRGYFPDKSPEKLQYILLHKSIGVIALGVALMMVIWRHLGKRPSLQNVNFMEKCLAKVTHLSLYIVALLLPLSGIGMSLFSGRSITIIKGISLPALTKNPTLAKILYTTHVTTTYAAIALVSLHVFAALYHHFIRKDRVLKRMLPFAR